MLNMVTLCANCGQYFMGTHECSTFRPTPTPHVWTVPDRQTEILEELRAIRRLLEEMARG